MVMIKQYDLHYKGLTMSIRYCLSQHSSFFSIKSLCWESGYVIRIVSRAIMTFLVRSYDHLMIRSRTKSVIEGSFEPVQQISRWLKRVLI